MLLLLKKATQEKIIRLTDFYFAKFVAKNDPFLLLVAACVSYECSNGHYFLCLNYFEKNLFFSQKNNTKFIKKIIKCIGEINNWSKKLIQHAAVGDGSIITPLVLYKKKIYLYKMWHAEDNFWKFIYNKRTINPINIKLCSEIINGLFDNEKKNMQKIAVVLSLIRNIIFIIGAPGTGKTTTIIKIIIALIKYKKNKITIQLSAPTGKATSRLKDILNHTLFSTHLSTQEKKNLPCTAITLHQLLNIQKISQKKIFNKNNKLKLDVLIIDEASMIDILMMENILCALEEHTQIIFIGDDNQLPPIESGSILRDLSEYANHGYSADVLSILKQTTQCSFLKKNYDKKTTVFSDNICILKKNYRFTINSGINIVSDAICKRNLSTIKKIFTNVIEGISYFPMNNNLQYENMILRIVHKHQKYWKTVHSNNMQHMINMFQNYQVLCLLRNGLFGVSGLNQQIENCLYQNKIIHYININQKQWYVGKPIMITQNNHFLGLYNGNIGIANMSSRGVMQVSFIERNHVIKNIPVNILKDYDTAWAITVHKAQGSEFNNTILVLPNMYSKVLNRDILYTATTRSKKTLSIYAQKKIFIQSLFKKKYYINSLSDKL